MMWTVGVALAAAFLTTTFVVYAARSWLDAYHEWTIVKPFDIARAQREWNKTHTAS